MNIIDAIKSGKKFRHNNALCKDWISKQEFKDGRLTIFLEDLLSEEWQVEPEIVSITLDQCKKIFELGHKHGSYTELNHESYDEYKAFLVQLGFTEEI